MLVRLIPQTVSGDTVRAQLEAAIQLLLSEPPATAHGAACLIAYFGLAGTKGKTQQLIADQAEAHGFARPVSRERVRQVVNRAVGQLREQSAQIRLASWDETVQEMMASVPIPPDAFLERFGFKRVDAAETQFGVLEQCADWFHLDWPYAILNTPAFGSLVVTKPVCEDWEDKFRRIPSRAGGAYVPTQWAANHLNCDVQLLRDLLDRSLKWERLDDSGLFYWKRRALPPRDFAKTGNPLLTTLLRVFSVVRRAWTSELALALARTRILRKGEEGIPEIPAEVVEAIAERSGLFEVQDGEISRRSGSAWRTLTENDILVLRVCRERGQTVASHELHGSLVKLGLSQDTARITVAYSPFLIHLQTGVGFKEGRYKFLMRPQDVAGATVDVPRSDSAAQGTTRRVRLAFL